MIAACIADPLLESASNAGWFGPGNFTDHSTWDIVPIVLVGLLFVALHLWLRVQKGLAEARLPHSWLPQVTDALGPSALRLVPLTFVAQVSTLYMMETTEQQVVYGHVLGGTLWLGAPILVSLTVHAMICALVTVVLSKALRAFSDATIQIVHLICALATLRLYSPQAAFFDSPRFTENRQPVGALGHTGERAPPVLTA